MSQLLGYILASSLKSDTLPRRAFFSILVIPHELVAEIFGRSLGRDDAQVVSARGGGCTIYWMDACYGQNWLFFFVRERERESSIRD